MDQVRLNESMASRRGLINLAGHLGFGLSSPPLPFFLAASFFFFSSSAFFFFSASALAFAALGSRSASSSSFGGGLRMSLLPPDSTSGKSGNSPVSGSLFSRNHELILSWTSSRIS